MGAAGAPVVSAPAAPMDAMMAYKSARAGEEAVNNSQGARAQRTQSQVGNAYSVGGKVGADRAKDEKLAQRIQNVASRAFYQIGPVWTDATYDAKKQKEVVKVRLYSPAYFALVRRNASLAKWAALGDQVLVAANATQAVQFGPDGKETLNETELRALAGK